MPLNHWLDRVDASDRSARTANISITKPETLSKPIQRALNHIAHSRSLLYQAACRDQIRKEIDTLLARGMSHQDAIEPLWACPPTLDPDYWAKWLPTPPIWYENSDSGSE
ncbi:hypothetical protein [Pseudomonas syringae]|uniref:hypothetical protein n=1 Tax=Pseudomonas syringae TaxID=317 RepID=UPI00040AA6CD|nr:hypothetical protein [Pseudomonas syringae]